MTKGKDAKSTPVVSSKIDEQCELDISLLSIEELSPIGGGEPPIITD